MNQLLVAARLFIDCGCSNSCKVVRVKNNVANFTNGKNIIIRIPVNAPDGYYDVNAVSQLVPKKIKGFISYPDIDSMIPKVSNLISLGTLNKVVLEQIIKTINDPLSDIKITERSFSDFNIEIGPSYFAILRDNGEPSNMGFSHNFGINPAIQLSGRVFSIALSAMLEYDILGIYQDSENISDNGPIYIGNSLSSCVILYGNDTRNWRYMSG